MKIVLFAYSRQGCATAQRAAAFWAGHELRYFAPERLCAAPFAPIPKPGRAFYGEQFSWADALLFVGSCGIAVRQIAPHLRDKQTDPAVLVTDELASFVIPLLSGHIGGANALARALAAFLRAVPVVTTATDIHGRFSVDAWAAQNGYAIGDIKTAKAVSAAILEGDVPYTSEFPVISPLPAGLAACGAENHGTVGIHIGVHKAAPFEETLLLLPRVLHIGIGCRRGTSAEVIRDAVFRVLEENELDMRAVRQVASIDLKSEEAGLLEFCRQNRWPIQFYTEQQLSALPGDFTASEFVRAVTGVDNVCERAAMMGAERLLVRKTIQNGATVAIAAEKWEVTFG